MSDVPEEWRKWLRVVLQMKDTPRNRILVEIVARAAKTAADGCDSDGAILKVEEVTMLKAEKPCRAVVVENLKPESEKK